MLAIVDYQMGNLRSVQKAFERVGQRAIITDDPGEISAASKVVLPGVGAFRAAMDQLDRRGLVVPILDAIRAGKPFLGICLGLQLLFEFGYEDGRHEGLGVLRGEVVRFDLPNGYKVPHMGWNQVAIRRETPILDGIPDARHFYFVHSYYVIPRDECVVAAEASYRDPFCCMVWRDNLYATQFHPEKSQRDGLRLLENFSRLTVS